MEIRLIIVNIGQPGQKWFTFLWWHTRNLKYIQRFVDQSVTFAACCNVQCLFWILSTIKTFIKNSFKIVLMYEGYEALVQKFRSFFEKSFAEMKNSKLAYVENWEDWGINQLLYFNKTVLWPFMIFINYLGNNLSTLV